MKQDLTGAPSRGALSQPTSLLVMAKFPVAGQVKTRMCPPLTAHQAATVARAALLDTLELCLHTAASWGTDRPVVALAGWATGGVVDVELSEALERCDVFEQRGPDFASRLAHAHAAVGRVRPGHAVVQIGMDTPQLVASDLDAVRQALNVSGQDSAALGMTPDGGWWVLGLSDPAHAGLLRAIPMSVPTTGLLTWQALVADGLSTVRVHEVIDVDDWATAMAVVRDQQVSSRGRMTRFVHQVSMLAGAGVPA